MAVLAVIDPLKDKAAMSLVLLDDSYGTKPLSAVQGQIAGNHLTST